MSSVLSMISDPCLEVDCGHGVCESSSLTCTCSAGYTGPSCNDGTEGTKYRQMPSRYIVIHKPVTNALLIVGVLSLCRCK